MAYATDGKIGTDFTKTTAGTTTDGENAEFTLGLRASATDGSEWVYVQAGGAITQYDWVAIDENFQAVAGTKTLADAGHQVGFAQVAFSDNDLGWVAVHAPGNISVNVAANCAPDVQLYTTSTAGTLDDTSASQTLIRGVVAVAAATASAEAHECIAVHPSATATP